MRYIGLSLVVSIQEMIICNWHIYEIASRGDAIIGLVVNPQTALRLSGVIEIMPLRGIVVAIADNHIQELTFDYPQSAYS